MPLRFVADFPSADSFLKAVDEELSHGGMLVRGAQRTGSETACIVEVRVAGRAVAELPGQVAAVATVGIAVVFDGEPTRLIAFAQKLRAAAEPEASERAPAAAPRGTAAERIAALTVGQKIALAMAGERDERTALLRDHNKVLHAYVLRNPRIQLDEVQFAAKLATLSPDGLKAIAEHPEWGQNPTICTALVRNPHTPLPLAIRMLPRLSPTEIRAIAKGGARDQIVHAARKILSG